MSRPACLRRHVRFRMRAASLNDVGVNCGAKHLNSRRRFRLTWGELTGGYFQDPQHSGFKLLEARPLYFGDFNNPREALRKYREVEAWVLRRGEVANPHTP